MNEPDARLYEETIHKVLLFHRSLHSYARTMQAKGISGRKIAALRHLLEASPCTVGELAAYHHISDSSASEMMAQLETASYVTRTRSEADNRVVMLDLTPAGAEFARSAPLGGIPLLRERIKELPQERLSVIDEALTELLAMLGADDRG